MPVTWVELWGFEPQTSCMPCKMRKFNCRQMPARDGSCHSSRIGHAQNDGQMTVKTILKSDRSHRYRSRGGRQSGKVPASQQAGQTHAPTVTIREAPMWCASRRTPSLYSSHTVPKRGSPARILTISALSRVLPVGGQISLAEANSEIAMVVRQPWSALAAD